MKDKGMAGNYSMLEQYYEQRYVYSLIIGRNRELLLGGCSTEVEVYKNYTKGLLIKSELVVINLRRRLSLINRDHFA